VLEPIADEQLPMNSATAIILQDALACLACKVGCICILIASDIAVDVISVLKDAHCRSNEIGVCKVVLQSI